MGNIKIKFSPLSWYVMRIWLCVLYELCTFILKNKNRGAEIVIDMGESKMMWYIGWVFRILCT